MIEKISITLEDLNNQKAVLDGLDNLFRTLIMYYATNNKQKELENFVLSASVYFNILLDELGYTEDEGFADEQ